MFNKKRKSFVDFFWWISGSKKKKRYLTRDFVNK